MEEKIILSVVVLTKNEESRRTASIRAIASRYGAEEVGHGIPANDRGVKGCRL